MNAVASHIRACASRNSPRTWILLLTGIIAFVIYAALVRLTSPAQDHAFVPERSSLAAAASNVAYGARLGRVYSGVLDRFLQATASTEEVLAEAARKEIEPGHVQRNTRDGNGIGYMLVAKFAFHMFGIHVASIVATMLMMMGISALALMYRFRDSRCAVVVLYFTSLAVMLFTPLVTTYVANIPIGGIRYFSLVGILPAFHLLLEIADTREYRMRADWLVPTGVQVVVLLVAILVRNSGAAMVGAIIAGLLLSLWKVRRDHPEAKAILRKAVVMATIGAVFIGVLLLSFSRGYLNEGRFTETVWHRIFVSLGLKQGWPYGDVRQMYDCTKYIPEGIVAGTEDRNGHCVWLVYADRNNIPLSEAAGGTYGRRYDAALREAFFAIFLAYPVEVLETFTVIKARFVLWSLGESLKFDFARFSPAAIWLLVAAQINLLVLAFGGPRPSASAGGNLTLARTTALLAALCLTPYFAVFAMPYATAELLFYCIFAPGLALLAGIGRLRFRNSR